MAKRDRRDGDERHSGPVVVGGGGALTVAPSPNKDKVKVQTGTVQTTHHVQHQNNDNNDNKKAAPKVAQPHTPQPVYQQPVSEDRWAGYVSSVGSTSSFHSTGPSSHGLLADGRWIGPDGGIVGLGGQLTPDHGSDPRPDPRPDPDQKPDPDPEGGRVVGRSKARGSTLRLDAARIPRASTKVSSPKESRHEVRTDKDAATKKTKTEVHEVRPKKDADKVTCKPRPLTTKRKAGGGSGKEFVPWCERRR